jgi:hypothetical protein
MSNRHVQPSGSLPAGLREALAATGRTRGSSATPAPPLVSPQPNRSFQSQINNIENAMQNTRVSQGGNRNTASNSVQSSPSQNPGGAPNHPRSQGLASSMHPPVTKSQGLVLHQGYRGAQNTGSNRGNVSSAGPSSAPMIEVTLHHASCCPLANYLAGCKAGSTFRTLSSQSPGGPTDLCASIHTGCYEGDYQAANH